MRGGVSVSGHSGLISRDIFLAENIQKIYMDCPTYLQRQRTPYQALTGLDPLHLDRLELQQARRRALDDVDSSARSQVGWYGVVLRKIGTYANCVLARHAPLDLRPDRRSGWQRPWAPNWLGGQNGTLPLAADPARLLATPETA